MVDKSILAPAAVLILWSVVMMLWMFAVRLPVLSKLSMKSSDTIGMRGSDLEGKVPAKAQWPAHNYNHLMEQPTIFYPAIIILALSGQATSFTLVIAWLYVMLRIMHSVWQALVNIIMARFALFALSSACLAYLAIQAVIVTTT